MNLKIAISLIFLSINILFSQGIERTELTDDEIQYLAKDFYSDFKEVPNEQAEISLTNNLINYEFEIIYEDNVIYRGVLNKPFLMRGFEYNSNRTKVGFCLDYNVFGTETLLEIIESKKLRVIKSENQTKLLCNGKYSLFSRDFKKRDKYYNVNNILDEKVIFKFFKLIHK